MPRVTKEVSEQTRQRILDVAADHFRERGFAGTDLVTVAKDAGVTRGAIYHHFPHKQALFEDVVARIHTQIQERIEQSAAKQMDPWSQLLVGCDAFIDAALDSADRQLLLVEAPAVLGWDAWRAMDEESSFASLTDVLQLLESQGEIPPGSADASARLLSGAMNEAVLWIASEENPKEATVQSKRVLARMVKSLCHHG